MTWLINRGVSAGWAGTPAHPSHEDLQEGAEVAGARQWRSVAVLAPGKPAGWQGVCTLQEKRHSCRQSCRENCFGQRASMLSTAWSNAGQHPHYIHKAAWLQPQPAQRAVPLTGSARAAGCGLRRWGHRCWRARGWAVTRRWTAAAARPARAGEQDQQRGEGCQGCGGCSAAHRDTSMPAGLLCCTLGLRRQRR